MIFRMKRKWLAVVCIALTLVFAGAFASCGGQSAYDIAVKNGFIGTEAEWLESLKGDNGSSFDVKQVYESLVKDGTFSGTYEEFLREYLSGDVTVNNNTYEGSSGFDKSCMLSTVAICATLKKDVVSYNYWNMSVQHSIEEYYFYGSGVIYSIDKEAGDAYIITNYHVIYDSESIDGISQDIDLYLYGMESLTSPYYANDYSIPATFIGGSSTQDIAVLKVTDNAILRSSNAKAVTFGNSDGLQVGDAVYAVGNPSAYGLAVSSGIVSKESDYITLSAIDGSSGTTPLREIRTDAAVNSGNSGGGLYNGKGELVGIVNAKSIATNVEGMGYALPSSLVKPLVENIIDHCEGTDNTGAYPARFGIEITIAEACSVYDEETNTLYIIERPRVGLVAQGGAADGKLQGNDIIYSVSVNGVKTTITRQYQLTDFLYSVRKGDTVTVEVMREGILQSVEILFDQDAYFANVA